jgi:hypothetical protein
MGGGGEDWVETPERGLLRPAGHRLVQLVEGDGGASYSWGVERPLPPYQALEEHSEQTF